MKKIIFLCLLLLIMATGCDLKKQAILSVDFNKVLSEKGYIVTNLSKQFENNNEIKEVFVAQDSKQEYQLEYYLLNTSEGASKFYENNVKAFKSSARGAISTVELNGLNYETYKQQANNKYQVISCVENTCIYANVDKSKKDKVKEVLEIFNY